MKLYYSQTEKIYYAANPIDTRCCKKHQGVSGWNEPGIVIPKEIRRTLRIREGAVTDNFDTMSETYLLVQYTEYNDFVNIFLIYIIIIIFI